MTTAGIIWATISRKFRPRRPGTNSFDSAYAAGAAITRVSDDGAETDDEARAQVGQLVAAERRGSGRA